MNLEERKKWKSIRRAILDHHSLPDERLLRAVSVEVLLEPITLGNLFRALLNKAAWRVFLDRDTWRNKKPSFLQLDRKGITIVRGENPLDKEVFKDSAAIKVSWDSIANIEFNKWRKSSIKISFVPAYNMPSEIFVRWFNGSLIEPYNLSKTDALYELLNFYHEKYGVKLSRMV